MARHERFDAWQRCHNLTLRVYAIASVWPSHERYDLVRPVRRAAVSAGANIAEGAARRGAREFARFLDIANGSLAELEYFLRLAHDLGYLAQADYDALRQGRDEAARSVWSLYVAVRRHARSN